MKKKLKITSNSGSAIGEAVGASMERAIGELLSEMADEFGFHYMTSGVRKTKAGKSPKKLLMSDNHGNEYDIDGVIANEKMQPLVLLESKYIRYKKHNRDKGSWICTAHSSIRKRYPSVRASVAVLAGSWSASSLALLSSFDVIYFLVPFDKICGILKQHGVDFTWEEKDTGKSKAAWERFQRLGSSVHDEIGKAMLEIVKEPFLKQIHDCLDDTLDRSISKVTVELFSNYGETKYFEFQSAEDAIDFMASFDPDVVFLLDENSPTMFDAPPIIEDE